MQIAVDRLSMMPVRMPTWRALELAASPWHNAGVEMGARPFRRGGITDAMHVEIRRAGRGRSGLLLLSAIQAMVSSSIA